MDGPLPEKRVGDRERREVDTRLQRAHADGVLTLVEYDERSARCWAARTRSDLDPLTADLPDPVDDGSVEEPTTSARLPDAPAAPPSDRHGGLSRLGHGVVAAALAAVAAWGGVQVLGADDGGSVFGSRAVQVAGGQERVQVGALFGSVRVVVPDGVAVRTTGTLVFGDVDCDEASVAPTGPVVTVDTRGAFGSVDVLTAGEAARAGDRDDPDDD